VPLIFALPGRIQAGQSVQRQVRLLDVTPTILDLLKIAPDYHFEGVSLKPLLTGKGDPVPSKTSLLPPEVTFSGALMAGSSERKSVRTYPWKLIYEIATERERLYNLERDPGETRDIAAEEPDILRLLRRALFKTILSVSDTWYIEMAAGGVDHDFSLTVGPKVAPQEARIYLYGLLDARRKLIVNPDTSLIDHASRSEIDMKDLSLNTALTLAFKVEPKTFPIQFDLRIDGKRAPASTYLGKDLTNPKSIPFSQKGAPAGVSSEGEPESRPAAPYFLVWHSGSSLGEESPAKISEETRKQLQALGYLH
jgi:hypothetical protein